MPQSLRVSAATTVVGVIGDPVDHSLSPLLHNTAFLEMGLDWVSVGFPVAAGQAQGALSGMRALGIAGLSVTMPHKDEVAALVDRTTPVATRLAAVNCVTLASGELVGSNTDGEGFVAALRHGDGFEPRGTKCLVVGAGGAARAVILALAEAGATDVIVVNRTGSRAAAAAALAGSVGRVGRPEEAATADLVVNATPIGMDLPPGPDRAQGQGSQHGADAHPGTGTRPGPAARPGSITGGDSFPLDPKYLVPGQVVVDLVYHPATTLWLGAARDRGATTHNGLGMLIHQAAVQLRSWTGEEPPVAAMWQAATAALSAR
ncbi:MAG TPA: shikimate dehydrogenase [Acidimicrobiales bacterium]|nr:shikimate dehydrogenase [Acidimicrobiales bacterium]